jgi:hypothetical protein
MADENVRYSLLLLRSHRFVAIYRLTVVDEHLS